MADAKPKMVKYTVAKGRTVQKSGDVTRDKDGNPTGSLPSTEHGPGAEVEFDEVEGRHLIAAGFLADPDADAPVISTGPKIQRTEP